MKKNVMLHMYICHINAILMKMMYVKLHSTLKNTIQW